MTAARINPDLAPLARPIADLKLNPNNARKHSQSDLAVLGASLFEHGQQKAIVAKPDGTVIAGNGTLQAALALGWESIACVTYDGPDEAHARAFAIVDNRSAELSEWSYAALTEQLAELDAMNTGFTQDEVISLMGSLGDAATIPGAGVEDRTSAPDVRGIPTTMENSNHVRMVQLFFNEQTHADFIEKAKRYSERVGTKNVTDTVVAALSAALGE